MPNDKITADAGNEFTLVCALNTDLSRQRIAQLFGNQGWRIRQGRSDCGVETDWADLTIQAKSPILLHGLVANLPERVEEILAPLRAADVPYVAECYDKNDELVSLLEWGDGQIRFVPSRVEGLTDVKVVTIYPDRIELITPVGTVTHAWVDIAGWPRPRWLWSRLYCLGIRPKWLPVGDRDCFHAPPDRFFVFYTRPQLKVYMPKDESSEPLGGSYFHRVQNVLGRGKFNTYDLG